MTHFRGAGIGAFLDQRNAHDMMTVLADDFHRVGIWILDVFFLGPKEQVTFGTFSHEHGHEQFSVLD